MSDDTDYLAKNKASWNARTPFHVESEFYNVKSFLAGQSSLNEIELNLLGDVAGKAVLHLQCHFGQDSLSLARMGAQVTGIDLSDKAIETAQALNAQLGTAASFVCCDLYNLPRHLDQQFDIVFTSYGTVGWLPDLGRWAAVVARFLKPGGRFIMADFHPVVWMMDNQFTEVTYSYFNTGALEESESGTYTDRNAPIHSDTVTWIHPLSDILGSLIRQGLRIARFEEFDYSPYNCFSRTEEFAPGKFRIAHLGNKIPMVYAIEAHKNGAPL